MELLKNNFDCKKYICLGVLDGGVLVRKKNNSLITVWVSIHCPN
jgi:hypothetical protein